MKSAWKLSSALGRRLTRLMAFAVTVTFASQILAQSTALDDLKIFDYSTDPDVVILSYSETSQMLANADPTPLIRVYGDGFVLIHYPEYMQKAGDYGLYLNLGEVTELLKTLSVSFGFNAKAVRSSRDSIKQGRELHANESVYRSDGTLEEIKVNLRDYRVTPGAPGVPVSQSLVWRDIAIDAREYPEIQELQNLNRARAGMRALLEHTDLIPVDMSSAR